jgi:hypothetical protein
VERGAVVVAGRDVGVLCEGCGWFDAALRQGWLMSVAALNTAQASN